MHAIGSTLLAVAATALIAPMTPALAIESSQRPSADERPSVKTVNRSYGGRVVQNSREQRLRIRFRGEKGDLVALRSFPAPNPPECETTVLRRLDTGRKVIQQLSDLWRLPRDTRYVVSYRQDCYQPVGNDDTGDGAYRAGVRLSKVVTHPLTVGLGPGRRTCRRGAQRLGQR